MSNDYRLAYSTISKVALNASAAYLWTGQALQADQISLYVYPWTVPKDDCTTFPAYARFTTMADVTTQRADGFVTFNWCFQYLTEGMVAYVEGAAFPGGIQSTPCTVQTRANDGTFQAYQATLLKPRPNQDYKRGYTGVEDYTLRFIGGALITS